MQLKEFRNGFFSAVAVTAFRLSIPLISLHDHL